MKRRESASAGVSAMFVGGQRICCRPKNWALVSICLNWGTLDEGPMICTQPEFQPGSTRFSSLKVSSPFSFCQRSPEIGSKFIPKLFLIP
jgi:hypothetical protein